MEKEEILLGVEMEKLIIEPVQLQNSLPKMNPFNNNFGVSSTPLKEINCACTMQKKHKHSGIIKKKPTKILKESLLKLLKNSGNIKAVVEIEKCHETANENDVPNVKCDPLNLCSLVQNCNQLKISSRTSDINLVNTNTTSKWWKNDRSSIQGCREHRRQTNTTGTCSQQALNPPCDVTIDELASYFETLVHIPKKMSSMAEMMYI